MMTKYKAALLEIEELKLGQQKLAQENQDLRNQLRQLSLYAETKSPIHYEHAQQNVANPTPTTEQENSASVHQYSKVEEKLAVYRSYFRGRDDVYPVRWSNKQGKSGYSPACGNEWTPVCQKPKVKCSVCTHQNFLPVTDEAVSKHLDARQDRTIGVYPMLQDETCWFLAMDFDKKNWQEDVSAVMKVCQDHDIPAALERSRSGNGGHIWIFFEEPIAATWARRFGTLILTLTMKQRYQLGLDSYDRLFPNQDTLPKGGFGNLIALPLQGGPRKSSNSTFVDSHFVAYEDQWRFLSELGKMSEERVSRFIQLNAGDGELQVGLVNSDEDEEDQPWDRNNKSTNERLKEPLPALISIVLSDRLYINKQDLSPSVINRLMRLASFSNPDFYKTQAMRLSTFGKPRVISCAEDLLHHIALPRGCQKAVMDFFALHNVNVDLEDKRFEGTSIHAEFLSTLTTLQDAAAKAILAHDIGILSAATAFGKTVVAASIIADRRVNTLILVHRRELMEQWKERLQTFLNLPKESIGLVGGGKEMRTGIVDIAVIQSLNHKGIVKEFITEYGQIIVDECHHVSAYSFEQVLMKAKAKYIFGLTATPKRQDGQEAIVTMQLGPIRIKIDAKMLGSTRGFSLTVVPRYSAFWMPASSVNPGIQEVYQSLVTDEARNTMIFDDLLSCLEEGRSPLLLVERTAHADYFERRLLNFAKNVIVLRGGMGKKQREAIREQIANIPDNEERVFIATGKLIGEGFDDARLDTLFLVHPISWTGSLQQYAGRLHRTHVNKKEVKIYDYIDLQVPVLMNMYKKRVKGYRRMGYRGAEL
ncbi:TOTE conflict system archaeo-eukaryotic primase domain-containing protein [Cohnella silvisoli]|uniref:DEAD/DEAH box helicase family protein n=1 Tax=Cohnella silvisoli TaxID=2873699 RepID=A0ABV1KMV1_9BACL|nr:DEAD/DEAH box helicase [Cohnella silvisoli]